MLASKCEGLAPLGQKTGNLAGGCACSYAHYPLPQNQPKKNKKHVIDGVKNVDVFESSTGIRLHVHTCHQRFTSTSQSNLRSPPTWRPANRWALATEMARCAGRVMHSFLKFIFPKFNFSVGANLFRLTD